MRKCSRGAIEKGLNNLCFTCQLKACDLDRVDVIDIIAERDTLRTQLSEAQAVIEASYCPPSGGFVYGTGEAVMNLQDWCNEAQEEVKRLRVDSNRWQALLNSPFRLFGYAGLDRNDPTKPCTDNGADGYAHFGCEMWTVHSGWKQHSGKEVLIGFADQAIKVETKAKLEAATDA